MRTTLRVSLGRRQAANSGYVRLVLGVVCGQLVAVVCAAALRNACQVAQQPLVVCINAVLLRLLADAAQRAPVREWRRLLRPLAVVHGRLAPSYARQVVQEPSVPCVNLLLAGCEVQTLSVAVLTRRELPTRRLGGAARNAGHHGQGHTRVGSHTPAASVAALPAPGPRCENVLGGLLSTAGFISARCFAWMASTLA